MAIKIDELETLLNRIWSGELKHDQRTYYSKCGTAACICGWDYALDNNKGNLIEARSDFTSHGSSPFNYSKEKYQLNNFESCLLFDEKSTPEIQRAALKAIKSNKTFLNSELCYLEFTGVWLLDDELELTNEQLVNYLDEL